MKFVVICTRGGTQYVYAQRHFTNMEATRAWAEKYLSSYDWSIAQLLVAP